MMTTALAASTPAYPAPADPTPADPASAQRAGAPASLLHAALLFAAAIPGLLFAPVFGMTALLLPIAVVIVLCFAVTELCRRVLPQWRIPLTLLVGLLGIAETELRDTTLAGVPTGSTVRALIDGATRSWLETMQTTWPAKPEPELLLFVPMAVLLVAVLGVELASKPLFALLPSLLFLGVSQAFVASTGWVALVAGLGYAAVVGVLLATPSKILVLAPTALVAVLASVLALVVLPVRAPAVSLQDGHPAQAPAVQLANPMDDVAGWLRAPRTPVFSYTATGPVDRWRLAVLDDFNGVSWTPDASPYRRMGESVGPTPGLTVPTTLHSAQLSVAGEQGFPWLPSQTMPATVTGADPLIDQQSGTLMVPQPGPANYAMSWWEPTVTADTLADAAIDPGKETGTGLGAVPPGISQLAETAVHDTRPSFETALVLARYLSQHYQLATGTDLPTGSGWAQLRSFLLVTKRGTSVQFAAAYVVLARLLGIPARVAVGFHTPRPGANGRVVVHTGDAFAWPEVAVSGVGWVPVDPTGAASSTGGSDTGLTGAVDKAITELPNQQDLRSPPLPTNQPTAAASPLGTGHVLPTIGAVLAGLLVLILLGFLAVPVLGRMRYWRRRRLTGVHGVAAACQEASDRLRANGVPVRVGMTVRELAISAGPHVPRTVLGGLRQLADVADLALWSGFGVGRPAPAWAAVDQIRGGLRTMPLGARLRAAFTVGGSRGR
jgi:hypothetical protein